MADVWTACKETDPDLILYHMKAMGAPDFAEKLGVPCMLAFWLPLHVPTTRIPAMGDSQSSLRTLVSLADLSVH